MSAESCEANRSTTSTPAACNQVSRSVDTAVPMPMANGTLRPTLGARDQLPNLRARCRRSTPAATRSGLATVHGARREVVPHRPERRGGHSPVPRTGPRRLPSATPDVPGAPNVGAGAQRGKTGRAEARDPMSRRLGRAQHRPPRRLGPGCPPPLRTVPRPWSPDRHGPCRRC